ncbi:hypothetical protein VZ95_09225 [Elstera litoralis]|uniref:UPF0033 domain-containing protein n=1 Tax=Elstera litoralis TaxID=552518 RepID=A0A0F3IHH7_9PROT|nr:hypothetical protein VZ95_20825 [Elstera litoralis]KJV09797.1 hypothetical protein VZ95_09225 [Elstera litoralis]
MVSRFLDQRITLDCTGLRCPLPILRFRKAMQTIVAGQQIALLSDDPNTHRDFADFCAAAGHRLLDVTEEKTGWRFLVEAGCAAETGEE